jgi:hypothetical protein
VVSLALLQGGQPLPNDLGHVSLSHNAEIWEWSIEIISLGIPLKLRAKDEEEKIEG